MGKRRQNRVKTVLPVRIWGSDNQGKPFIELAHTLDVSHSGVRLGGVNSMLEPGSGVGVQCRHRKAQYEIAWVGRPGSSRDRQVGLRTLEGSRDIFNLGLKNEVMEDDYVIPLGSEQLRTGRDLRKFERFTVSGSADVGKAHGRERSWAEVGDVSAGGCYLNTLTPFPVNSEIELTIRLDDTQIQVIGKVRTCHPMVGMGIEFLRFFTEEEETKFSHKLKEIEARGVEASGDKLHKPVKPDSTIISNRLAEVTRELEDIDQLIQNGPVDQKVLAEFRDAVGQVRTTAWALQRWMELESSHQSPFPVLSYLNSERIALATRICDSLYNELSRTDVPRQKQKLDGLLKSVERLFTHLAGIDFAVLEPDAPEALPDELAPDDGEAEAPVEQ